MTLGADDRFRCGFEAAQKVKTVHSRHDACLSLSFALTVENRVYLL
jgi:hypothetical protein